MSMSLRDQLLKAGLISQKQARDAERQQERVAHQPPKHKRGTAANPPPAPPPGRQGAKLARDQELNRQQREKAQKKELRAQIKQLIEQNRLPQAEGDEGYHFVDGNKIRRVAVSPAVRGPLGRGEIVIVRHVGGYELVPAAIAARIRERDPNAVLPAVTSASPGSPASDDAYREFPVPDDLIW